jgi:hypothetical protein
VVLHVPAHTGRRGPVRRLPTATGTCLLIVALLCGTLLSAWAGWRFALPAAGTSLAGPLSVPGELPGEPAGREPVK